MSARPTSWRIERPRATADSSVNREIGPLEVSDEAGGELRQRRSFSRISTQTSTSQTVASAAARRIASPSLPMVCLTRRWALVPLLVTTNMTAVTRAGGQDAFSNDACHLGPPDLSWRVLAQRRAMRPSRLRASRLVTSTRWDAPAAYPLAPAAEPASSLLCFGRCGCADLSRHHPHHRGTDRRKQSNEAVFSQRL